VIVTDVKIRQHVFNVYSDIDTLLEVNTDTNANERETIVREEQSGKHNENETL
jgi:hypothetical protein